MKWLNMVHEEFSCDRGGRQVCVSVLRPRGKGPFPAIVLSEDPGANRLSTLQYAAQYAHMGYAAFSYCLGDTETNPTTEVEDLEAVMDSIAKRPYVDRNDLSLMGCSRGGAVSALVAAELGADVVKKLILFSPELSKKKDTAGEDPIQRISRYRGPVLLCCGKKDRAHDTCVQACEACKAADKAAIEAGELDEMPLVWLESIDGGRHWSRNPFHRTDALNTVKEFLAGRYEVMRVDVKLITMTFKLKGALLDWDIPFGGKATGDFFNGTVRSGAHDQRYYGIGTSDVTADYYIDGKDCSGEEATVHVVNKGVSKKDRAAAAKAFSAHAQPGSASPWKPVVSTTSNALDFMNHTEAFARLRQRGLKGPLVRIFMDYDATK